MTHNNIYYLAGFDLQDVSETQLNVYAKTNFKLDVGGGVIYIVGESHFLDFADLGFKQVLLSAGQVFDGMSVYEMIKPLDIEFEYKQKEENITIKDRIYSQPFDEEFVANFVDNAGLKYDFDHNDVTAVKFDAEQNVIVTLHSYHQHNKLIVTETRFLLNST